MPGSARPDLVRGCILRRASGTSATTALPDRRQLRDNRGVRVALRVSAVACLAAGVLMARPAVAAMTMALRDDNGQTRTFYQDGSRVRIVNPSGTDDGEARIVDLKSTEHIVVYDDAKAWCDYNKTVAQLRAAFDLLKKTHQPDKQGQKPTVSYRALGENRQLNGFSCAT